MTVMNAQGGGSPVQRGSSSSLADVIELILDKGLVVDVFVRVSLVGIELITIDARIVVASVDTYLRFAEATNRLDLHQKGGKGLLEVMEGMTQGAVHSGAQSKTKGMLDAAKDKFDDFVGTGEDQEEKREKQPARGRRESRSRERGS